MPRSDGIPEMSAGQRPVRVLVVVAEPRLLDFLARGLRLEGWDVSLAATAETAVGAVRRERPDAVVLDVTLRAFDAVELLRRLRDGQPTLPVLFLIAPEYAEHRMPALTAGCDEYATKPFALEEVLARLRVLLRQTLDGPRRPSARIIVGNLVLDEDTREVVRGNDMIRLTAREFELLRYLMRNQRRVVSKAQILGRVWAYDFVGHTNVVELYISYLRRKIDVGRPPMIHTLRGVGYVIKPVE